MTLLADITAIDSSRRELRRFGITSGLLGLVAGIVLWWYGVAVWPWPMGLGIFLMVIGSVFPLLFRPVYRIWMALAIILGWIVTRVILIIVFYAVLTPIGLVARLFGKRFLQPGPDPGQRSYWVRRSHDEMADRERYERQF